MTELLNNVTQGDCLEVMQGIPDKSVDMILCDLPYGTTACKWDSIIPFDKLWAEYERVIKDNGAIVLFGSQPFTTTLISSNARLFKYELIWMKNKPSGHLNAKIMPMKAHENILVFYKKKPTYNPQMVRRTEEELKRLSKKSLKVNTHSENYGKSWSKTANRVDNVFKHPNTILKINTLHNGNNREKKMHPTQKPVELFEYLIKTFTNENEIVLDNCIGSGTTAVAAINSGRQFIGIERESEYVEIANKRITEALSAKEGA